MRQYRTNFAETYEFDGTQIDPAKFGINRSWLRSRILRKRVPKLMHLKIDIRNLLKSKKDRSKKRFLLQFAHLAFKFLPNGAYLKERYIFGILKTKLINPYRYYRFFMGYPTKNQRT